MKPFVRYFKRVLLMLALLALIVIVAGAIYIRTDSFGRLLKGQVSNLLATSFRGEVTVGEIDSSIWGALIIHELSIKNGGATVVRIREIRLSYSLIPLLWHEARIEIKAVDPEINLQRESDGEWNLMKALAPSEARPGRRAEQREDAVAGRLHDVAVIALDRVDHDAQRRVDNRARLFGIHSLHQSWRLRCR